MGYYQFDTDTTRTIFDQSGNNSNGIAGGDTTLVCGVSGRAFKFDGIKDFIILVGSVNNHFGLADFSLTFFMKPSPGSGVKDIISKKNICAANERGFAIRYAPSSKTLTCELTESASKNGTVSAKLDATQCWQHIALVRSSNITRLYVNGTLRSEVSALARVNLTNQGILSIANSPCINTGGEARFGGLLDELRVYAKALTEEEVVDLYRFALPDHILTQDTLIFLGGSVPAKISGTCVNNFQWQPTTGVSSPTAREPILKPTKTTSYRLLFRDGQCIATDSVLITVIDPDSLDCEQVFLPKAFTPNGNGPSANEMFGVSNPYAIKEFLSLEILDQWGGKMFSTSSVFERWDGSLGGSPVSPGVYLYRVRLKCKGEEKIKTGSFTLMR